jgi:hypothetical protein
MRFKSVDSKMSLYDQFWSRRGQASKIDDGRCGLDECPPGPIVLGAEPENKAEIWVDNSFAAHTSDSPTASWANSPGFNKRRVWLQLVIAPHCFQTAVKLWRDVRAIEPSGSFDRKMHNLIRAYEVGLRLDSMAAYVS